jgi:peptidoglycan-associated lipoprotein
MVKQIFVLGTALFMFGGCSQSVPDFYGNMSDTISIDENGQYTESADGMRYNSSSDGFASVYFDFDGYTVAPSMEGRVAHNAKTLQKNSGYKVKVEGNCDEFGTDEYNYALGLKRAKAIKDALSDQGVDTSALVMVSLGESNPVCTEATDECYARNRRVDFHLVR